MWPPFLLVWPWLYHLLTKIAYRPDWVIWSFRSLWVLGHRPNLKFWASWGRYSTSSPVKPLHCCGDWRLKLHRCTVFRERKSLLPIGTIKKQNGTYLFKVLLLCTPLVPGRLFQWHSIPLGGKVQAFFPPGLPGSGPHHCSALYLPTPSLPHSILLYCLPPCAPDTTHAIISKDLSNFTWKLLLWYLHG